MDVTHQSLTLTLSHPSPLYTQTHLDFIYVYNILVSTSGPMDTFGPVDVSCSTARIILKGYNHLSLWCFDFELPREGRYVT